MFVQRLYVASSVNAAARLPLQRLYPWNMVLCKPVCSDKRMIAHSIDVEDEEVATATSFAELKVDDRLLSYLPGTIQQPTEVQIAAIPPILEGKNVAIQSHTGSGKTLSYLLPVMTRAIRRAEASWKSASRRTRADAAHVQAVIVTPNRELAMQIVRVAESLLSKDSKNLVQQCIGGANFVRQREALRFHRPVIVVGTPGRLAELSRDGALQSHNVNILVLDEADQLLAPQFREEMSRIAEHTGKKATDGRQTIVVSATLTPKVLAYLQQWCPDPEQIFIGVHKEEEDTIVGGRKHAPKSYTPVWGWSGNDGATSSRVFGGEYERTSSSAGGFRTSDAGAAVAMPPQLKHFFVPSSPQHKVDVVRRAIHAMGAQRVLIFMNFQHRLKDTEAKLAAKRMAVKSLHGELTKQERANTLNAFKSGKLQALVVSDVAARGLDIPECDAVIHLELPSDPSHYAHRAGRTGRAGRPGAVVSIISGGEKFVIEKFGKKLGVDIAEAEVTFGDMRLK